MIHNPAVKDLDAPPSSRGRGSLGKPPLSRALIIGGNFSGIAAAIALTKLGVDVELVEPEPRRNSFRAGVSVSGPTLRAIDRLGVLPEFLARGWCGDGVDLFTARGVSIAALPTPRLARADVPGVGAILRPALAQILYEAASGLGVEARLGVSAASMTQSEAHVDVRFTDGTHSRYDLVVGADGLHSPTRQALFPHAPRPRHTGQSVWRAVAPVGEVRRPAIYLGARSKAAYDPMSRDELHVFVTENRKNMISLSSQEALPLLAALLAEFDAPELTRLRKGLGPKSQIVFRPLESLLMPQPWAAGRVLLIGDAVHAATPHLASGEGLGIEDALVLAEELAGARNVSAALGSFQRRRWGRCRMVVQNSLRLGEIEVTNGSPHEHARLMRESMLALMAPY